MYDAFFFDRDGVINIDYGYVSNIEDVVFNNDILKFMQWFSDKNYKTLLFIITNQSGIERGYYTKEDYDKVMKYIIDYCYVNYNIIFHDIEYCDCLDCYCRKPKPYMINKLVRKYNIDIKNSYLMGDKNTDIVAAFNSGIPSKNIFFYQGNYSFNRKLDKYCVYVNNINTLYEYFFI